MTTTSNQITVTTTAAILVPQATQYQEVTVHSTATVYVGGSTVSTTNGFKIDNGDKLKFTIAPNTDLYAVANSGTSVVYTLATVL